MSPKRMQPATECPANVFDDAHAKYGLDAASLMRYSADIASANHSSFMGCHVLPGLYRSMFWNIFSVSGPKIFRKQLRLARPQTFFTPVTRYCAGAAARPSSVAVGSRKMVRYGRPAGKRAALSPKTREKAVADQDDVGWPFGMLREYSLLGVDAVDQRRPTDQHQEDRDGIPFL